MAQEDDYFVRHGSDYGDSDKDTLQEEYASPNYCNEDEMQNNYLYEVQEEEEEEEEYASYEETGYDDGGPLPEDNGMFMVSPVRYTIEEEEEASEEEYASEEQYALEEEYASEDLAPKKKTLPSVSPKAYSTPTKTLPELPSKPNSTPTKTLPELPSKPNSTPTKTLPELPSKPSSAPMKTLPELPSKPSSTPMKTLPELPSKPSSTPTETLPELSSNKPYKTKLNWTSAKPPPVLPSKPSSQQKKKLPPPVATKSKHRPSSEFHSEASGYDSTSRFDYTRSRTQSFATPPKLPRSKEKGSSKVSGYSSGRYSEESLSTTSEAVSFDEPVESSKLTHAARNKGPQRRPPTRKRTPRK